MMTLQDNHDGLLSGLQAVQRILTLDLTSVQL